ncbi:MAG TPA: lantibiotic dehydratase, partial [Pseudonocardiaceae bacterium]|nr:lantibiotic dehydratase [Pseudonocardiaceae bacterium]
DGWTGDRLLIQDRAAAECTDTDQVRRAGWSTVDRVPANSVDVYRRSATGIAESYATRLAELVHLGLRALALTGGTVAAPALPAQLGPRPRLLPDLATERWVPVALAPGRGPLDRWIGEHADGADSIDLDVDTLDRLGAPTPTVDWPVDCLVRPIRAHDGPVAVLDRICPAGVLDAQFASAMRDLYPRVPQADEYRRFLCEIGARAGIPVVEVLVPPTTAPTYSSWWTGDPARAGQPGIYVSPARITLRTDAGQVIAEVDGRRIWPVGHTTHAAPPPWDRLSALLMLASPQPPAWSWRPVCPDRDHVPRITVGGGLVVSVERWRLPCGQLWQRRDRPLDKVTALLRLRRRHGLPRWVTVAAADGPVVLDLDSLRSIPVIERLASRGVTCLDVSELLPNPNQLPVRDESAGGASVAELVLRLPWRQTGRSVW